LWSDADGSSGVVAYEAASGGLITEFALPDADRRITDAAVLGSGTGTQFAVLRVDGAGEAAIDLVDAGSGSVNETWGFFEPDYEVLRLVVTENVAGVLAVSPTGELELEVRTLASGTLQRRAVVAGSDWLNTDLARAGTNAVLVLKELGGDLSLSVLSLTGTEPDRAFSIGASGDAAVARALVNDTEATLLVVAAGGDTSLRRFALDNGSELLATPVLATDSTPRALFGFAGGQLGVLGSDAGGDVFAEQRDADSGELVATLTAQASSPPSPPPPPPPSDTGGGGGAVGGYLIVVLCTAVIFGSRRRAAGGGGHSRSGAAHSESTPVSESGRLPAVAGSCGSCKFDDQLQVVHAHGLRFVSQERKRACDSLRSFFRRFLVERGVGIAVVGDHQAAIDTWLRNTGPPIPDRRRSSASTSSETVR
jgi:hypothetical protein